MATSAFRSSSKRGTTTTATAIPSNSKSNNSRNRPIRRSRSVSAVDIIPPEFSNKRDNPLFSDDSEFRKSTPVYARGTTTDDPRGRSVTRGSAPKVGIGRSVSRVRGRSVSRGHYQSDKEEILISKNYWNQSEMKVANSGKIASLSRNAAVVHGQVRNSQRATRQGQVNEYSEDDSACSLLTASWEDAHSNGSLSEADEKTPHKQLKYLCGDLLRNTDADGVYDAVWSEARRANNDIHNALESAIQRIDITSNVTDIPSDTVNPGVVGLVLDIRREYTSKLQESEDRARKLREDLAVEEQRGQELSRILREMLPEPNTSNSQRSRIRRRASHERKTMSKRLTEEAMVYFDECVSISTFDGSDFSAPEDPPQSSVGTNSGPGFFHQVNPSTLTPCGQENKHINNQLMSGDVNSGMTANSSIDDPLTDEVLHRGHNMDQAPKSLFSAVEMPEIAGVADDIRSYVKQFGRDSIDTQNRSSFDADEYKLQGSLENFLFDKVLLKNRVESGSLHLCGGGFAAPFSSFGPAF